MKFELVSDYQPAGDQPRAISQLVQGITAGEQLQTLLGVTGSGKTFTIANVIQEIQKPTLVIAHNKTLAAQLAQEFRAFFPNNAVHYFVSYYDYYQPEAYVSATDTYIEKDAQINEEIDRLRHASTQSLLTRRDVIIVASVSCIYGLGSPKEYFEHNILIKKGGSYTKRDLMETLVGLHYERTNADVRPGTFRSIGNMIEVMPIEERVMYHIDMAGSTITHIATIDPVTSIILSEPNEVMIFPTKHFVTDAETIEHALADIKSELQERLKQFESEGKLLEAERLKRRTTYDMAMIREVGYCSGIENYSRHLSRKAAGEPPETLLSYFPKKPDGTPDFLTVIDESHVTLPQIGAMYAGDRSRKENLVEYGFRLPSALDNRPLRAEEFWDRVRQTIFVSATPGRFELEHSQKIVEQIIRPTGLIDPEIIVQPAVARGSYVGQVQDFVERAERAIRNGGRVLATTLTKRMAEDLSLYLKDRGLRAEYLHSDIETLDRIKILTKLRAGQCDVLVGVNLLREGLDLPEVTLIGILDADKEGFLRSETSLVQTIGRAARNVDGVVVLYADTITNSMERAISETQRRRSLQMEYNRVHGITPQSITKHIADITELIRSEHDSAVSQEIALDMIAFDGDLEKILEHKRAAMHDAARDLDFETAAIIRDEMIALERTVSAQTKKTKRKKRA